MLNLLHVPNHYLKDILNYGTINNTNSSYYGSIEVLIGFINSIIAIHVSLQAAPVFTSVSNYLWWHEFSV